MHSFSFDKVRVLVTRDVSEAVPLNLNGLVFLVDFWTGKRRLTPLQCRWVVRAGPFAHTGGCHQSEERNGHFLLRHVKAWSVSGIWSDSPRPLRKPDIHQPAFPLVAGSQAGSSQYLGSCWTGDASDNRYYVAPLRDKRLQSVLQIKIRYFNSTSSLPTQPQRWSMREISQGGRRAFLTTGRIARPKRLKRNIIQTKYFPNVNVWRTIWYHTAISCWSQMLYI